MKYCDIRYRVRTVFVALLAAVVIGCDSPTPTPVKMDPVRILSPNGGEIFKVGDTVPVKWTSQPDSLVAAVLEISSDAGKNWFLINDKEAVSPGGPLWGNYPWVLPRDLIKLEGTISIVSDNCQIRVRDYSLDGHDESDGLFSIRSAR